MSSARPGTREVAPQHQLDAAALGHWLSGQVADFRGPLQLRQFEGGQSNPTFHVAAASGEYVLRKQPPGQLLASAHALDREYRVQAALTGSGVPVPRLRGYCADPAVIGTPFYVMDYQPGRIFTNPLLPELPRAERGAVYEAMNATLARLHAVDWRDAGLGDFGRPDGYLPRQIERWTRQYQAARVEDAPELDELRDWLQTRVPPPDESAIAHGDYRLGNLIFAADRPEVVAVLDWELATIGHPLADLAYNCLAWHLPSDYVVAPGFVGLDLEAIGIPPEHEYVAAYARRTGRDAVPDWRYFLAFSLFRIAAIQQGVYARALQGNAASATARRFGDSYRLAARIGCTLACAP
ncbi:MAG: phosphotransferase family protein [Gammaproteobacteria bacterium]|nr:MAG: phosphotransferase family protein [Gammaproteobacteria bacterium]